MTYCFAWKYQDAVLLLADTLVTQSVPADRSTTSSGELHRQLGREKFVHERLLKLREIKEGVAVAIAGDVQLALAITDFIQDNIGIVERAADVIPIVEASFGPFDPARGVQILLIQATEDGECAITRWDSQDGRHSAAHNAYIGSLAPEQADRMADLFQRLIADKKPSKEAMLLSGMAFVNSLSQHEDTIAQGVGGTVCGLRVQRGKTLWPGDLVIIHHRDGFSSIEGRISVHAREGIVCVNSTYHGTIATIFANMRGDVRTTDLMQAWMRQWTPYLKDYLSKHFTTCTRWMFINLDHQTPLVFVVHARLEQASDNLRIARKQNGDYNFTLGSELAKAMRREAPSVGPDLRIVEVIDPTKGLPDGMIPTQ
jgi:hypothetical protein